MTGGVCSAPVNCTLVFTAAAVADPAQATHASAASAKTIRRETTRIMPPLLRSSWYRAVSIRGSAQVYASRPRQHRPIAALHGNVTMWAAIGLKGQESQGAGCA